MPNVNEYALSSPAGCYMANVDSEAITLMCLNIGTPKNINIPFQTVEIWRFQVSKYLRTLG